MTMTTKCDTAFCSVPEILLMLRAPGAGWLAPLLAGLDEACRDPDFNAYHRAILARFADEQAVPAAVAAVARCCSPTRCRKVANPCRKRCLPCTAASPESRLSRRGRSGPASRHAIRGLDAGGSMHYLRERRQNALRARPMPVAAVPEIRASVPAAPCRAAGLGGRCTGSAGRARH